MKNKNLGFILGAVVIMGVLTAGVVQYFSPPGEEAALERGLLNKFREVEEVEIATEDTLSAMQVEAQGAVAIGVSLVNLDNHPKDHLEFDVLMDTHSVDLEQYDLAGMSQLSLDGDLYPVETMEWRITEGEGHHLRGRLIVTGKSLDTAVLEVADAMELKIYELDGVSARVFRWEPIELANSEEGVSRDS
ncbi:MAG: hypothetical protein SCK57_09670 [Bacillota bacterium]|nr:hypothetical protein [Bacillota bacterium]MDW7677916.1 hypothetical protein [Bacillota bacterium]